MSARTRSITMFVSNQKSREDNQAAFLDKQSHLLTCSQNMFVNTITYDKAINR